MSQPATRPKVIFLIDGLLVGGAEKSLLDIARHFRGTEAVFCHIYRDAPLKPAFEAAGIRVISLNVPGRYAFPTAIHRVHEVIRQEQPDLIHATLYRSCIVSRFVARKCGIPLVNSFVNESYGPERYRSLSVTQKFKRDGLKWLDRHTVPWVDLFISNSDTIAISNRRYLRIPNDKVATIYRGRSLEDYQSHNEVEHADMLATLGVSPESARLLCVGRLWPHKRHADLIRALPLILAAHADAVLLLAGDGPERASLERLAVETGVQSRVRFLGIRHDIPALLQIAALVVSASEYEGLPGAVIEAMLAERPVVLSSIPVHQEMIHEDETGLFFTLHDSEALARQVVRLLDDRALQARLAGAALAEAREKYDIRKVAAHYEKTYRELFER